MQLEAQELLDVSRAMEASLESDVEEESPDEPSPPALSSSSDEEEEKEQAADAWSAETSAVNVPPFEAPTGKQHAARHANSPLEFLQLFLPPGLLQQWADYTNDLCSAARCREGVANHCCRAVCLPRCAYLHGHLQSAEMAHVLE